MTDSSNTVVQIPDIAVQAALDQLHINGRKYDENDFNNMRCALTAALPHIATTALFDIEIAEDIQELLDLLNDGCQTYHNDAKSVDIEAVNEIMSGSAQVIRQLFAAKSFDTLTIIKDIFNEDFREELNKRLLNLHSTYRIVWSKLIELDPKDAENISDMISDAAHLFGKIIPKVDDAIEKLTVEKAPQESANEPHPICINISPKPLDLITMAKSMLTSWDQFMGGTPCSDQVKADADLLIKAACFAAQAYEDTVSAPITADAAPGVLLRIFLTAIVDPASTELDPYRAKNKPDGTLTNEGTNRTAFQKPASMGKSTDVLNNPFCASLATATNDDTKPVDGFMTPEEHRLEDLKQMAAYNGPIVSFEVNDPHYLASCDHCGWVGSTELCGTDSFGDDSDVYCPRCHTGGADSGKVAERYATKPVDLAAVQRQAFEKAATLIDEGFEKAVGKSWRNDGKPSKNDSCPHDKFMYEDCENCASAAIRALSAEPAQGEQWRDMKDAPKDGTVILAWHITHKCPVSVLWKDDGFPYQGERLNWFERTYTSAWPERAFSHWMPLPAAPISEAVR